MATVVFETKTAACIPIEANDTINVKCYSTLFAKLHLVNEKQKLFPGVTWESNYWSKSVIRSSKLIRNKDSQIAWRATV